MSVYRQAPRKQVEVHETRSLIEVQPRASSVSLTATVLNWEDEETIDSSLPSDFPAPRRSTKQSPTHSEDIMTFPLPPTIFVAGAEQDALDSNSEQSSWSPSTASPSDLQDRYENDELFSHS